MHSCYSLISQQIFYMFWAMKVHHQELSTQALLRYLALISTTWSVDRFPNDKAASTALYLLRSVHNIHWWVTAVPYILGHNIIAWCLRSATNFLTMNLHGPKHVEELINKAIINTV
jgi:hypothetical protein